MILKYEKTDYANISVVLPNRESLWMKIWEENWPEKFLQKNLPYEACPPSDENNLWEHSIAGSRLDIWWLKTDFVPVELLYGTVAPHLGVELKLF